MLIQDKEDTQTELITSFSESPRLAPIENPEGLMMKGAYKFLKMKMGKVITPFKVIQARFPESISLSSKLAQLHQKLTLDKSLKFILKSYVATINGCAFCVDISKSFAVEDGVDISKYDDLLKFEESTAYTEAEKAALRYVDQATRYKRVDDTVFDELKAHYSEREIVEITWLNAMENYYNLLNKPLNIPSDELCSLK